MPHARHDPRCQRQVPRVSSSSQSIPCQCQWPCHSFSARSPCVGFAWKCNAMQALAKSSSKLPVLCVLHPSAPSRVRHMCMSPVEAMVDGTPYFRVMDTMHKGQFVMSPMQSCGAMGSMMCMSADGSMMPCMSTGMCMMPNGMTAMCSSTNGCVLLAVPVVVPLEFQRIHLPPSPASPASPLLNHLLCVLCLYVQHGHPHVHDGRQDDPLHVWVSAAGGPTSKRC